MKSRSPIILATSLPLEFTIKVIGIPLSESCFVNFSLLSKKLLRFFTFNSLKNFWISSYFFSSILTKIICKSFVENWFDKNSNFGNSFLHGTHQVAQKFIRVNFAEKSLKTISFPFLFFNSKIGKSFGFLWRTIFVNDSLIFGCE